jgi:hypothetical protein
MKTSTVQPPFRLLVLALCAWSAMGLVGKAQAQEVISQGVANTSEIREGTKVEMSDSEVAELKQWIQNAKYALEQLQENFRLLSLDEKLNLVRSEFDRIVNESGAKANELYVRYILNRALLVSDIVGPNPGAQEKESLLGLYVESIELAQKHYVDDAAYLDAIGRGVAPSKDLKHIAVFGVEYADRLLAYSQTFLDPRVEYKLTRTALGLLGNDLNSARNLDRAYFTQEIIKIQQLLKVFPQERKQDTRAVMQDIRRLKFEYRENLRPRLKEKVSSQLHIQEGDNARVERETRRQDETVPAVVSSGRIQPLKIGTNVLAPTKSNDDDFKLATVIGFKGDFVIVKFKSGNSTAVDKTRVAVTEGCKDDLCVGMDTLNMTRELDSEHDVYPVRIAGVMADGKFVITFMGGRWDGDSAGFWDASDLAKMKGCVNDVCVGQKVFNIKVNAYAEVLGISRADNRFVLKFLDGKFAGDVGHNWSTSDLAHTQE